MALLTAGAASATDCNDLISSFLRKPMPAIKPASSDTFEIKYLAEINALEETISRLRRWKESPEPAITLKLRRKLATIESYLMNNHPEVAQREWRTIFRQVEMSTIIIEKYEKALIILSKPITSGAEMEKEEIIAAFRAAKLSDGMIESFAKDLDTFQDRFNLIARLKKEIQAQCEILGNHYEEYTMVRELLDKLADETFSTGEHVEKIRVLLQKIGVDENIEKIRFPTLLGNEKRPSLENIQHVLHEHPLALIIRLKHERDAEMKMLLTQLVLQPALWEALWSKAIKLPWIYKTPIVKLLSPFYNTQARALHFPLIHQVILSPLAMEKKIYLLRELNSSIDNDELLVTFSRRIDEQAEKCWEELKNFLSKQTDQQWLDFHKRLLAAEEKGTKLGEISLVYGKSNVRITALTLVAGGYLGYEYGPRVYYWWKGDKVTDAPKDQVDANTPSSDDVASKLKDMVGQVMSDTKTNPIR